MHIVEPFIDRFAFSLIEKKLKAKKVLILYGARRVGKTELLKYYLSKHSATNYLWLNGEDLNTQNLLSERSISNYRRILGDVRLLVLDEAQKVPDIGSKLKLMVDEINGLRIIATGSSSFDLIDRLGEPLVGRKSVIHLFPLAQLEFSKYEDAVETEGNLVQRMIYGGYPELTHLSSEREKIDYLNDLVSSYLLRDILSYEGIRKPDKLLDLLRLLAFQIGHDVSVEEIAKQLKSISRNTVESYLDLLTKVFVIYPVRGYSNNLRKEITKSSRWFFADNGIRNALIQNFNPIQLRNDVGMLWENYLVSERIKWQSYNQEIVNNYFWRTYDQQELDWVEAQAGQLAAYEFKWGTKKAKIPVAWSKAYPQSSFQVIDRRNYLDWIT